jgi:uncharacterized phage protein (TIGR01671 family)
MSRVIKFRGMANDETESAKVWKYGYYKTIRKQHRIITMEERGWYSWAVDGDTVGQFTGLLDCNGAEIFEGDVIQSPKGPRHLVDYVECSFVARFIPSHFDNDFCSLDKNWIGDFQKEIIGNIHQQPELLK